MRTEPRSRSSSSSALRMSSRRRFWQTPGTTIHLRAGAAGWPGRMAHLVSPAWQAVAPEHNVDPATRASISPQLASATGGHSVSLENISGLDPTTGGTGTAKDLHRLWPWCLILALLAYFGDLLFRRWPGSMAAGTRNMAASLGWSSALVFAVGPGR